MDICKKLNVVFWVSLSCIGMDQVTKVLASQHLSKNVMISHFSDLLRVGYTENIGAFLGLGNSLSDEYRFGFFVIAVGAFLIGLLVYIFTSSKQNLSSLIALSMVFSGGFSNLVDVDTDTVIHHEIITGTELTFDNQIIKGRNQSCSTYTYCHPLR
ncbi:signal peptidase II [Photobacterium sp. J15]|uniref:signal peptidase II n=1 Tax=Photobacterium sp. J15 TaxID=265901 RepID=UPI000AF604A9|nr:signal peptidase II [Photobacterium sp. J15]